MSGRGILLTIALWLALAGLWSHYLEITNYSLFYAGLSQLMIALIFFQFTAITILLGAEFNRGIMEMKRMRREAAEEGGLSSRGSRPAFLNTKGFSQHPGRSPFSLTSRSELSAAVDRLRSRLPMS